MRRSDLNGCNIYCGYYIGRKPKVLLCVSEDKRLVKAYLKGYRGLSKKEYSIEETFASYIQLIDEYDPYVINCWNGHYIPTIDHLRMDLMPSAKHDLLFEAVRKLNWVTEYAKDIRGISTNDISILSSAISTLVRFSKDPKLINQLESFYKKSELFAPIEDHIRSINTTLEMINMDKTWRDHVF